MTTQGGASPRKRARNDAEELDRKHGAEEGESSSDEDLGPALPSAAPKKKRRKLPHEKLYLAALPTASRYSKSLMHKEQLSFVTMTPLTDFLITTSAEGTVKFWKKSVDSVEFVKEFRAHTSEIRGVAVSQDGRAFATAGIDNTIKIFDVLSFDLLTTIQLKKTPKTICWVHKRGASLPLLAVSWDDTGAIDIYDGRGESSEPINSISNLHKSPVSVMAYNSTYDCVVSADVNGFVEYWSPSGSHERPEGLFEYKSSTNLFDFKKCKSVPTSITMSPNGSKFASISFPDRKVRIFDFATGKLYRTYDESIATLTEMQQAGTALRRLEDVEFGRRLATERDIENTAAKDRVNVLFDESGHFILYGSMLGTKVINILTNKVVRVYGGDEPFRAVNLALYQGQPQRKNLMTAQMLASSNPLLEEAQERDPLMIATGSGKIRFYIFSNDDSVGKSQRDIQNEKPRQIGGRKEAEARTTETGTAAVVHTTYGDIHLRLFPEAAPKAVENFVTHAKNGYYNNTIFHRVIRKFMIQCGDPLGDGTGGESIWGKEFEDEFSTLKHDKPYTVSMANAGPNTNGSQFFITTEKTPWLDKKHTIFGRAVQGLDVVHRIENARTYKEKPEEDIKIVSISVS